MGKWFWMISFVTGFINSVVRCDNSVTHDSLLLLLLSYISDKRYQTRPRQLTVGCFKSMNQQEGVDYIRKSATVILFDTLIQL